MFLLRLVLNTFSLKNTFVCSSTTPAVRFTLRSSPCPRQTVTLSGDLKAHTLRAIGMGGTVCAFQNLRNNLNCEFLRKTLRDALLGNDLSGNIRIQFKKRKWNISFCVFCETRVGFSIILRLFQRRSLPSTFPSCDREVLLSLSPVLLPFREEGFCEAHSSHPHRPPRSCLMNSTNQFADALTPPGACILRFRSRINRQVRSPPSPVRHVSRRSQRDSSIQVACTRCPSSEVDLQEGILQGPSSRGGDTTPTTHATTQSAAPPHK